MVFLSICVIFDFFHQYLIAFFQLASGLVFKRNDWWKGKAGWQGLEWWSQGWWRQSRPQGNSTAVQLSRECHCWGVTAMAPHSSTLVWRIPGTEAPGGLQSIGSLSQTQLSDFTFTFHFHALEKEMASHSSVLAWKIPGTGEPGGLPSMGSHRVGQDWSDLAVAVTAGKTTGSWAGSG